MCAQSLTLIDALLAAASAAQDLPELLGRALDALRSATGAHSAAILLLEEGLLRPAALRGCDDIAPDALPPVPEAYCTQVTWTQDPVTAPLLRALSCPSACCLPLEAPAERLGCLLLGVDPGCPPFACDDARVSTATRVLGLAIAHARLRAQQPGAETSADGPSQAWLEQCRLAAVGRLIPAAAHDLNNPLQAVTGYAQLLLASEALSEEARRDVTRIHTQAQRAAQIVENVLSVARPHKPEHCLTDVSAALERTLALLSHPLRANGIDCTLSLPAEPLLAWTDPGLLRLLLLYVLTSALDARIQAGGDGCIAIRGWASARNVQLEIVCEAPADQLEATPRSRKAAPGTPADDASAQGLSIAARIVASMGGQLQLGGAPPGAAALHLELPATEPPAGAA